MAHCCMSVISLLLKNGKLVTSYTDVVSRVGVHARVAGPFTMMPNPMTQVM